MAKQSILPTVLIIVLLVVIIGIISLGFIETKPEISKVEANVPIKSQENR